MKRRERFPGEDAAAHVSLRLRKLLNVDPDDLEPIPLQCAQTDLTPYLERQFNRWRQIRQNDAPEWVELGLRDRASVALLLGYLTQTALKRAGLSKWLRENLGHITGAREAEHARGFLAMRMAEVICFGLNGRSTHRPFAVDDQPPNISAGSIQPRLHAYAERERLDPEQRLDDQSPHFLGFVAPFLARLQELQQAPPTGRPAQPGDLEITNLLSALAT